MSYFVVSRDTGELLYYDCFDGGELKTVRRGRARPFPEAAANTILNQLHGLGYKHFELIPYAEAPKKGTR